MIFSSMLVYFKILKHFTLTTTQTSFVTWVDLPPGLAIATMASSGNLVGCFESQKLKELVLVIKGE